MYFKTFVKFLSLKRSCGPAVAAATHRLSIQTGRLVVQSLVSTEQMSRCITLWGLFYFTKIFSLQSIQFLQKNNIP